MIKQVSILAVLSLGLLMGCTNEPASNIGVETESASQTAASPTSSSPASEPTAAVTVYAEDGIAIGGADPVAYFQQAEYVPGTETFEHEWMGATWRFSNAENRDAFASNPEAYAPQYGGFCAWAVSQGYTASIDPTAWKIVDGQLYLNYSKDIQRRWERDIPGNIAKADANWPAVLTQ